MKTHGR